MKTGRTNVDPHFLLETALDDIYAVHANKNLAKHFKSQLRRDSFIYAYNHSI